MSSEQVNSRATELEQTYGKFEFAEPYDRGIIAFTTDRFFLGAEERGGSEWGCCTVPTNWQEFVVKNYFVTSAKEKRLMYATIPESH